MTFQVGETVFVECIVMTPYDCSKDNHVAVKPKSVLEECGFDHRAETMYAMPLHTHRAPRVTYDVVDVFVVGDHVTVRRNQALGVIAAIDGDKYSVNYPSGSRMSEYKRAELSLTTLRDYHAVEMQMEKMHTIVERVKRAKRGLTFECDTLVKTLGQVLADE